MEVLENSHHTGELWDYLGLPGRMSVASYLTADYAVIYRLIVDVMLDHQPEYLTGIPHDELTGLLRERLAARFAGDPDTLTTALTHLNLTERLTRLEDWGVVNAWEDKVRSDEDFTRHRGRYQLTETAARLHREVRRLGESQSTNIAAALAPPVIAEHLTRMRDALATDPAAIASSWSIITPTMGGMSDAAAGWQAKLAAALSGTPDPTKIADLNETLNGYISMWGSGIDTYSTDIAANARDLLTAPDDDLRRVALHLAGATAEEDTVAAVHGELLEVLGRVLSWFDGPTSQAAALRRQMRDTIVPLVRNKRALAAVGGHISRRTELLNLAEQLDQAADEDAAWDVWATYTGLFSARHLGHHTPSPGAGADTLSFWDAAEVPLEAKLRRQGPRASRGRPSRIYDRTAGKESARLAAAYAAREEARTRGDLLAHSGKPLSEWSTPEEPLSEAVAGHLTDFLMTLDAALTEARRRDTDVVEVTTSTSDGLWELTAVTPDDDRDTIVHLPTGRLVYSDISLTLTAAPHPDHAAPDGPR